MFLSVKVQNDRNAIERCARSGPKKLTKTSSRFPNHFTLINYRKIPKISPGAYIFERPFLRGLFLEGLIFGGAYLRREICVSNLKGLAL